MTKIFYRYDINNSFDDIRIRLSEFVLLKETPQGYWITYPDENLSSDVAWKKWVSKTGKKRFAYPTKREAKISFIRRTERRFQILNSQMNICKTALERVDDLIDGDLEVYKPNRLRLLRSSEY